jgi:hypothetical protein
MAFWQRSDDGLYTPGAPSSRPSTPKGWPLMDRAAGGPPVLVLGF